MGYFLEACSVVNVGYNIVNAVRFLAAFTHLSHDLLHVVLTCTTPPSFNLDTLICPKTAVHMERPVKIHRSGLHQKQLHSIPRSERCIHNKKIDMLWQEKHRCN